jgi:arylformamidase
MWIDISVPLASTAPAWPGDTPFTAQWTWSQDAGSSVNVSAITLSPHVGTHADAPYHVQNGWGATEELPLVSFIGPCTVVDVSAQRGAISFEALGTAEGALTPQRLLLKTGQTVAGGTFPEGWPWLDPLALELLLARGLRLLGVDAPSVDSKDSKTLDVHRILFSAGACNLENLDLRSVPPGEYDLFAAPLAIVGLDAAPVRALLRARA